MKLEDELIPRSFIYIEHDYAYIQGNIITRYFENIARF